MKKVTFLTCGGTIDKDYGIGKGIYDVEPGNPVAGEIIDKNLANWKYEIIEVLRKDSLDMNDEDRRKVKEELLKVDNDKVIITHGTDTMIETGKFIESIKNKVVILVGSARPYSMKESDAEFNIGYVLGILDILADEKKYGVYIAMNGEHFNVNNVEKGEDGVFKKLKN